MENIIQIMDENLSMWMKILKNKKESLESPKTKNKNLATW
jgi:hypothetical protein